LTRFGTRRSRLSRSASISSVSTVSASAIGSTRPSTELIAEAFALARAADEPGDVDEFDLRFDFLRGTRDFPDLVEPRIGHRDAADVRLDRAEGVVRRLRRGGFSQGIEKRRFADVRQADDAAAKAHGFSGLLCVIPALRRDPSDFVRGGRRKMDPGSSPG
jgi:hypothetical protein